MRWTALLTISILITLLCSAFGLPAALLLGPMIGGIIFGANGLKLTIPRWPYLGAQAVIGAMVSAVITPAIVATLGDHSVALRNHHGGHVVGRRHDRVAD